MNWLKELQSSTPPYKHTSFLGDIPESLKSTPYSCDLLTLPSISLHQFNQAFELVKSNMVAFRPSDPFRCASTTIGAMMKRLTI